LLVKAELFWVEPAPGRPPALPTERIAHDNAAEDRWVLRAFAQPTPAALVQLAHPNLLCYRTKGTILLFQEAERRENVVDAQPRSQLMDKAHLAERFLQMSGGCECESGDRARVRMCVGLPPRFERPIGRFFVTPQAKQRAGPCRANGVHHRIERTQITRYIRRLDRRLSIARLRLDETHGVITAGKIGTQRDGLFDLSQRCGILFTPPERPSHRPVRRRVTMIRQ